MTDVEKREAARAILEKLPDMNIRIDALKDTARNLTQRHEAFIRGGGQLSRRTQQNHQERMNELQRMIDRHEQERQSIIAVIESITESTKFERGCREYLLLRYVDGLTHEAAAERMELSREHMIRKRVRALQLFSDAMDADAATLVCSKKHADG